jgi:TolA-binding protein
MASVPLSAESSLRLADQLQVLSQVAESLTYRLLELEERLERQEHRIGERLEEVAIREVALGEAMDQRLEDTEERLAGIEAALEGLDRPGGSRHLQSVHPPALQQDLPVARHAPESVDLPSEDADPFPDEGEQPFMDELIAS